MAGGARGKKPNMRIAAMVVPIVAVLVVGYYVLTEYAVMALSSEKFTFKSENYAKYLAAWTDRILGELEIYKDTAISEGELSEHALDLLTASNGAREGYPYGLYWGDVKGSFFDASGWIPDEGYVPSSRNWYIEGLDHEKFAFGEPYIDSRTGLPCVSATVNTTQWTGTESVLAADIYFDYARELVERLGAQEIDTAFFVSRGNRMIIADSDQAYTGVTLDDSMDNALYKEISKLFESSEKGLSRVLCEDGLYYVNICEIENVNWYLITCMREKNVATRLAALNVLIIIVGILGCLLLIFLASKASATLYKANREARTDPLTGLFNRSGFRDYTRAGMKAAPTCGALVLFDIDNFKLVNDNIGHPEGDIVLKSFAELLGGYFNRNGDICARLGGDEFAVYVGREVGEEDIKVMLESFIQLFHNRFDDKYPEQGLSVSIGATFRGSPDNSLDDIYAKADKALYEAKNGGKDRFIVG